MKSNAFLNRRPRRLVPSVFLDGFRVAFAWSLFWLPVLAGAMELLPEDYEKVLPQFILDTDPARCQTWLLARINSPAPNLYLLNTVDKGSLSDIHLFEYKKNDPHHEVEAVESSKLKDRLNSGVNTKTPLKALMSKVSDGSTVIVQRGSELDPSVVLKIAGDKSFVIDQRSDPEILGRNLNRVLESERRGHLSFFDFSPRSDENARGMNGFRTNVRDWRASSRKIAAALSTVQSDKVIVGDRTLRSLFERLKNPDGAVVVIYGHSDGNQIWLDTQDGVRALTPAMLQGELGGQDRLPIVVLLNCETEAVLAPTFLGLGAPLVFGSDQELHLNEIVSFVGKAGARMNLMSSAWQALYGAAVETNDFDLYPIADKREGCWQAASCSFRLTCCLELATATTLDR